MNNETEIHQNEYFKNLSDKEKVLFLSRRKDDDTINDPDNYYNLEEDVIEEVSHEKDQEKIDNICNHYFKDRFIIIDSDLFMNKSYDWFFDMLNSWLNKKEYKDDSDRPVVKKVLMAPAQYEEINNYIADSEFGTPSNKSARLARRRIEEMFDNNVLNFLGEVMLFIKNDFGQKVYNRNRYGEFKFLDKIHKRRSCKYSVIATNSDFLEKVKKDFRGINCHAVHAKKLDYR